VRDWSSGKSLEADSFVDTVRDRTGLSVPHVAMTHEELYQETLRGGQVLRSINSLANPLDAPVGASPRGDQSLYAWKNAHGEPGYYGSYVTEEVNALTYRSPLPDVCWGAICTAGGLTGLHVDTCGFHTNAELLAGAKIWIWYVLNREQFSAPDRFLKSGGYDMYGNLGWKVCAVLVREGERL
jgi:hypothetical protein